MTPASAGVAVSVAVAEQSVVCVGAGHVAAAKVVPLLEAGASVTVVAPAAGDPIAELAAAGALAWRDRRYRQGDLAGALLVVAATGDQATNERVAADAADQQTLCVNAGGGSGGTAAFMASVRRGPLLLAVSTGGGSPALAAAIRRELDERYGPEYGELAHLLAELRVDPHIVADLTGLGAAERAARWRAVLDTDILAVIRTGRSATAKEMASACLRSSSG